MSNRAGNKGLLVRLAFLVILGGAAIVIAYNLKSPLAITEVQVRKMIQKHELIGLSLDQAAEKLQHQAPPTTNGTVVFDFGEVKGWTGQSVCLDVKDGQVTAATWIPRGSNPSDGGDK